ncbi:large ribosomal subunit protein mL52 [Phymastichus coffea]|uniref:large ribosomal subunit protein mL52 n=1 Tax=Phymastichus coffea TaxID=108790 RepID=UPI00273C9305|nr:large ribosomal subunit protein mL52 [Phymastichus coffea]
MSALKQVNLFKVISIGCQTLRNFHLNPVAHDVKWRMERKLCINPNAFGPLTNLPDYSFKDGRPVPFGSNQKRRIDKQRENLVRIKALVSEIDYAVIKHEEKLKKIEEEKQRILGRKLKTKGDKLLADGPDILKIVDKESKENNSKLLTSDS